MQISETDQDKYKWVVYPKNKSWTIIKDTWSSLWQWRM